MKLWLSALEIADLKLDGFPASKYGVQKFADREEWASSVLARKREGRTGGGGMEYHIDLLPLPQKLQYAGSFVAVDESDLLTETSEDQSYRAIRIRDARLMILKVADRFKTQTRLGQAASDHLFLQLYAEGVVPVPEWVTKTVKRISRRSLARWRSEAKEDGNRLSHDPAQSRKATGVLDQAEQGELKNYVMAALFEFPHFSAETIRSMTEKKFGARVEILNPATGELKERELPPLRTFQHTLKRWKEEYASAIKRHTNPDGWKNSDKFVMVGGASAGIVRLNQLWEIDASPVDMLTTEGRWNVYACIDVWSRRTIFHISCTPRASAVGLLLREALLKWGIPEIIKTDNGSDFIAKQTKRLLQALDIEHDICPPFSPEKKPHVERVIGTYQHSFVELLPGFVGHNVAERSVIEGRRAFARRLGIKDYNAFNIDVTPAELQDLTNQWAENVYEQKPHQGLKGLTPAEKAARSEERILQVDTAALDVLLAPLPKGDGLRTVTKEGIRVNNERYMPVGCAVMPQDKVFCRMDPKDIGKLWLFDPKGEVFLGNAICADLAGADPAELIAKSRAMQKAYLDEKMVPIRKAMKSIGPREALDAILSEDKATVLPFPQSRDTHETAQTLAAAEVSKPRKAKPLSEAEQAAMARLEEEPVKPATVTQLKTLDDPERRFARAQQLEARIASGSAISGQDHLWLTDYQTDPEYTARMMLLEREPDFQKQVPPAS